MNRVRWLTVLPLLAVTVAGCSERLLRENVLATTQSMIGVQVAQNPQTQIYELKAGFARNEFFLVPTSKRVHYQDAGRIEAPCGPCDHNDPSSTPQVLAEIQVGGRGKQGIGASGSMGAEIQVYQRLAVGSEAVKSRAALALMASDARTAEAVRGGTISQRANIALAGTLADALSKIDAPEAKSLMGRLDDEAKSIVPPAVAFRQYTWNAAADAAAPLASRDRAYSRFDSFASLNEYMKQLNDSMISLGAAIAAGREQTVNGTTLSVAGMKAIRGDQERLLNALGERVTASAAWSAAVRYVCGALEQE